MAPARPAFDAAPTRYPHGAADRGRPVPLRPHEGCDKLPNHLAATGLSDVARVYQRAQFLPERKAALEAWARHVVACGEGVIGGYVAAADFEARREAVA